MWGVWIEWYFKSRGVERERLGFVTADGGSYVFVVLFVLLLLFYVLLLMLFECFDDVDVFMGV